MELDLSRAFHRERQQATHVLGMFCKDHLIFCKNIEGIIKTLELQKHYLLLK